MVKGFTPERVDSSETTSSSGRSSGYARLDLRVTANNEVYFIEANPNPILAEDEDFAQSAMKSGLTYPQLIERIIRLGVKATRE